MKPGVRRSRLDAVEEQIYKQLDPWSYIVSVA
jgi:hypothetical protein